jgi:hypothetical protein
MCSCFLVPTVSTLGLSHASHTTPRDVCRGNGLEFPSGSDTVPDLSSHAIRRTLVRGMADTKTSLRTDTKFRMLCLR